MAGVASTGKAGIGAKLELASIDSPTVYAAIANIVSMEVAGVSLNMIDATHVNSPDMYTEMLPGLKTSAPWTGTVQYDNDDPSLDSETGLRYRLEQRLLTTLRVNLTGVGIAGGFEADGYVSELGNISIAAESIMTQPFTFTVTGPVRIVEIAIP